MSLINDSCMASDKKDQLRRTSVRVLSDSEIILHVHSPVAKQYLYTLHARVPVNNVLPSGTLHTFFANSISRFVMFWKSFLSYALPFS